jgi:hypothetical protein
LAARLITRLKVKVVFLESPIALGSKKVQPCEQESLVVLGLEMTTTNS